MKTTFAYLNCSVKYLNDKIIISRMCCIEKSNFLILQFILGIPVVNDNRVGNL